ncbi:WD40 repeat-like protein [Pseudovirgaria hyperparasitica]|uniref:Probable cytosolic iron-sulfur protein assembly protein 1 n=1 Tax=Pseudovirgaria hyperparasitica TaxID=470096 RepID=A0A6A6WAC2_9PEZI|nr:WD40 repeat-like protein [Pseudovirgaria hyperparasitica]KAF2759808.1 WD40 repeat-like protein [Pseudovirgaria hyperparasitica]
MPLQISHLANFTPPASTRTWQSQPHPTLPLLATASSDKTVRIYSLTSFNLITTLSGGHKRSIRSVAWQPALRKGDAVLATGSFDASAGIWKKHYSGDAVESLNHGIVSTDENDNDEDDDDDDGEYAFTVLLDGHESEIKSLAFAPSSRLLATCSRDKSVWIWEELDDDNWETMAVLSEHDGDVKCVAWHPAEDLLASASYDDTIRLYKEDVDDWEQVAVIQGHKATVWCVTFEGADLPGLKATPSEELSQAQRDFLIQRAASGPRLLSASDDLSIRIWRREPPADDANAARNTGVPSIIRSSNIDETWLEEAQFPGTHTRAVYSASWSTTSGLVVSAGSDGMIVVYKEQWKSGAEEDVGTEWTVVASIEAAHGVFEVNHVVWAKRWDKGRRSEDEEVIVSTGDDGEVKVWTLEEAVGG